MRKLLARSGWLTSFGVQHALQTKVSNDVDGRKTFSEVLDGWTTDAQLIAGLEKVGGDVAKFKASLAKINNFASFATEDEFGNFLQTRSASAAWSIPTTPRFASTRVT